MNHAMCIIVSRLLCVVFIYKLFFPTKEINCELKLHVLTEYIGRKTANEPNRQSLALGLMQAADLVVSHPI